MFKIKLITVLGLGTCLCVCKAQSSFNTSGATISSSSGNVSYSLGGVFFESDKVPQIFTGVQYPYEIVELKGDDVKEIGLKMKVYPNPTSDILYLRVDVPDYASYRYELFDSSNKFILSQAVNAKYVTISMAKYPSSLYFLNVFKNNKIVKVFKLIKN